MGLKSYQYDTKQNIQGATTGKPYNLWASNSYWYYATTRATCTPNFVQFWGGHVQTFAEL